MLVNTANDTRNTIMPQTRRLWIFSRAY